MNYKDGKFIAHIIILSLMFSSCTGLDKPDRQLDTPSPVLTATLSPAQVDATEGAILQATRRVQATLDAQATAESQIATATQGRQLTQEAGEVAFRQIKAQQMAAAQATWQPILSDSFDDNSLGWPIGNQEDETMVISTMIQDGKYLWTMVEARHSNSYWNLTPANGRTFSDFYARVNIEFISGDTDGSYAFGLVFRHVNDDYGFFGLRDDGRFQILAVFETSIYQDIVMRSTAILPGQPNQIGVRSSGSDFIFLINDQPVWYMNEDFSPGEVGLGVEVMVKGPEAQMTFTDFEVFAPK